VKRLIGESLVVGLLSACAMVVAAGPSSAAMRNQCMDEANYNSHLQWYEDQWSASFALLEAWANADHYVNPVSGQEVWDATYLGASNKVYSLSDYNQQLSSAATTMVQYDAALGGFLDAWSVCP
jgi:hypothetical protein